ncbi:SpoIIE family protein phosphatase [Leptospira sp. 96542]|nr:SpoIIE family protein phosphatase [Leptospira sp. 96542]
MWKYKIYATYTDSLQVIRSKSFITLFFSMFLFIILPFTIITISIIYKQYLDTLDWNHRFQLVRVQLLAIDMENSIRDQISILNDKKEYLYRTKDTNIISQNCSSHLELDSNYRNIKLVACSFTGVEKSYILVSENRYITLYSADFLEDELLDSPFSEPNEGLLLVNSSGDYGVSGFIEENFRVTEFWLNQIGSVLQTGTNLPNIKETTDLRGEYFLSSFPMYGLPFQLFVVSPKNLILNPIYESLFKNVITLISLLGFSLFFSGIITLREIESKRKLKLILNEFPNAAILFNAESKELLSNIEIDTGVTIYQLFRDQRSVWEWVHKEVKPFLQLNSSDGDKKGQNNKKELEFYSETGETYLLEFTYHLWQLDNNSKYAKGALVLIQNITTKRLEFEKEMQYAKTLQKKYLPQIRIFPPNIDYEILYLPLIQVGGDYYDYIELENNRYIFALGDIIGHGVQAAMMMTVVRVLFHQILKQTTDPEEILIRMNEGVSWNLPKNYSFVPFHFIIFDFNTMTAEYGNAGHPGMYYFSNDSLICPEKLNPMFGMLPKFSPKVVRFPIQKSDRFYLFTDGLRDVRNTNNKSYGEKALEEFLRSMNAKHLSAIKSELEFSIRSFSEGTDYLDDITWIGIQII